MTSGITSLTFHALLHQSGFPPLDAVRGELIRLPESFVPHPVGILVPHDDDICLNVCGTEVPHIIVVVVMDLWLAIARA